MNKKIKAAIVLVLFAVALSGCKKEQKDTDVIIPLQETEEVETKEPSMEPEATKEVETHKGKAKSTLTGEWIKKSLTKKRPYAIMINNILAANPQSGTSQASILYEAVVEGGITRMMGIFEDFDAERIGSTRSARHYFVSFADEYDAIYVHFGQTKYADAKISELRVDNLSGLSAIGSTVFYRDNSIKAPHNAFASYNGIIKGTKQIGYRTKLRKNVNTFDFYEDNTDIQGKTADKVILGFSNYTSPYFTYNKKTGLYDRYQFGGAHIDKAAGKQLSFQNIIIQIVNEWDIDKNGYQTMDIEHASGKGYYITNGKAEEITWEKNESDKTRTYYGADGKKLTMNPGKTYIAIYPKKRLSKLSIS